MTSGTFVRVRLFTDIEDITLDKWLDAENAGQDELAKKILDAGLLVEHMIAEIPLDQNLADNSELKQLTDNADRMFGLIVCFECNRAFQTENDQTGTCPNCGGRLSRPRLTPTNLAGGKTNKIGKPKRSDSSTLEETDDSVSSISTSSDTSREPKKPTPSPAPTSSPASSSKSKRNKKQVREPSAEKHEKKGHFQTSQKDNESKTVKYSHRSSRHKDEIENEEDGWFGESTPVGGLGKHAVKSH